METENRYGEEARTASEAEAAEASFGNQHEDHTLPARQVLYEKRDNATNGLPGDMFIP